MKNNKVFLFLILSLLSCPLLAASVQDAGEAVDRRGTVKDDYYAAGATVTIDANVKGDVIAAGGTVSVSNIVREDVMVAGGTITLRGKLRDDVRAVGGTVTIDAKIGDDLLVAGGEIELTPKAHIAGKAWIAGGSIDMNGTIDHDLAIGGGEVAIAGTVHGDVQIEAGEIELKEGARIDGNLTYKSPRPAEISKGAVVKGKITYTKTEHYKPDRRFIVIPLISLTVAGIVLLLIFPNFTQTTSARVQKEIWKNLGLGFAMFVTTPVAAILLICLVVGFHVGLPLLFIYGIALLTAFLVGAFCVANYGARLLNFDTATRGRQVAAFIGAMLALTIVRLVPIVGGLFIFLLMITALGAVTLQLYEVYRGGKNLVPALAKNTSTKKTNKKKTSKKKKSARH